MGGVPAQSGSHRSSASQRREFSNAPSSSVSASFCANVIDDAPDRSTKDIQASIVLVTEVFIK